MKTRFSVLLPSYPQALSGGRERVLLRAPQSILGRIRRRFSERKAVVIALHGIRASNSMGRTRACLVHPWSRPSLDYLLLLIPLVV